MLSEWWMDILMAPLQKAAYNYTATSEEHI